MGWRDRRVPNARRPEGRCSNLQMSASCENDTMARNAAATWHAKAHSAQSPASFPCACSPWQWAREKAPAETKSRRKARRLPVLKARFLVSMENPVRS